MPLWRLTFHRKGLFEREEFFKDGHTAVLCTRWKDEAWETNSADVVAVTPSEGPFSPDAHGWEMVGKGLTAEIHWEFSDSTPDTLREEVQDHDHDIDAIYDLGWTSGDMTREVYGPLTVEKIDD